MSKTNDDAKGRACGLCDRVVQRLTRHHLVPRTRHKNKRNKKTFDRQEIHRTVDLEREHNTIETLKAHPDVERFVEWIRRKPPGAAASTRRRASHKGNVGP